MCIRDRKQHNAQADGKGKFNLQDEKQLGGLQGEMFSLDVYKRQIKDHLIGFEPSLFKVPIQVFSRAFKF